MSKVNLSKALKLKNSLIAEIGRLKGILSRENSRSERSTSTIDRGEVFKSLTEKTLELVSLKSKIARANVGIYEVLAAMEEAKSAIGYYQTLNVTDGEQVEHQRYGQAEPTKTKYNAYLKQEDVDKLVSELQKKIEEGQDAVDAYNATTFIEV